MTKKKILKFLKSKLFRVQYFFLEFLVGPKLVKDNKFWIGRNFFFFRPFFFKELFILIYYLSPIWFYLVPIFLMFAALDNIVGLYSYLFFYFFTYVIFPFSLTFSSNLKERSPINPYLKSYYLSWFNILKIKDKKLSFEFVLKRILFSFLGFFSFYSLWFIIILSFFYFFEFGLKFSSLIVYFLILSSFLVVEQTFIKFFFKIFLPIFIYFVWMFQTIIDRYKIFGLINVSKNSLKSLEIFISKLYISFDNLHFFKKDELNSSSFFKFKYKDFINYTIFRSQEEANFLESMDPERGDHNTDYDEEFYDENWIREQDLADWSYFLEQIHYFEEEARIEARTKKIGYYVKTSPSPGFEEDLKEEDEILDLDYSAYDLIYKDYKLEVRLDFLEDIRFEKREQVEAFKRFYYSAWVTSLTDDDENLDAIHAASVFSPIEKSLVRSFLKSSVLESQIFLVRARSLNRYTDLKSEHELENYKNRVFFEKEILEERVNYQSFFSITYQKLIDSLEVVDEKFVLTSSDNKSSFTNSAFILPDDPYKPDWGLVNSHQEWYEYVKLLEKGGVVDCYLLINEIFDRNNPDAQKIQKDFYLNSFFYFFSTYKRVKNLKKDKNGTLLTKKNLIKRFPISSVFYINKQPFFYHINDLCAFDFLGLECHWPDYTESFLTELDSSYLKLFDLSFLNFSKNSLKSLYFSSVLHCELNNNVLEIDFKSAAGLNAEKTICFFNKLLSRSFYDSLTNSHFKNEHYLNYLFSNYENFSLLDIYSSKLYEIFVKNRKKTNLSFLDENDESFFDLNSYYSRIYNSKLNDDCLLPNVNNSLTKYINSYLNNVVLISSNFFYLDSHRTSFSLNSYFSSTYNTKFIFFLNNLNAGFTKLDPLNSYTYLNTNFKNKKFLEALDKKFFNTALTTVDSFRVDFYDISFTLEPDLLSTFFFMGVPLTDWHYLLSEMDLDDETSLFFIFKDMCKDSKFKIHFHWIHDEFWHPPSQEWTPPNFWRAPFSWYPPSWWTGGPNSEWLAPLFWILPPWWRADWPLPKNFNQTLNKDNVYYLDYLKKLKKKEAN